MVMTMRRVGLPESWWDAFESPDGVTAEIIRGELVLTPSPSVRHGAAESKLFRALDEHLPEGCEILRGIEWRFAGDALVAAAPQPDLLVFRDEPGLLRLMNPPLLAVEVLSPSDAQVLPNGMSRIEGKRLDYAANGLEHYLEVAWTAKICAIRRYERHDGELAVVAVAEGDDPLIAEVPYPYEIVPSRL
jgi:Uma2 family endonuclease